MIRFATCFCALAALGVGVGGADALTLTTTFAGGNALSGNIFDVETGASAITVTGFDLHVQNFAESNLREIAFYLKTGTSTGFESDAAAWTLMSTETVSAAPFGEPTVFNVTDFTLDANTRYGFYLTTTSSEFNEGLHYTDGTSLGGIAASNADLTIFQGYGLRYAFGGAGKEIFSPRTWNGSIIYEVGAPATSVVPVPAALPLMAVALGALGLMRRRRG